MNTEGAEPTKEELRALVLEVLEKGYLLSLGTHDEGGVWVADVSYVHDDNFNMYWASSPLVRHSKAIEATQEVAGTITVSSLGEDNLGIQLAGRAAKVEGLRHDLAEKYFAKKGAPMPTDIEAFLKNRSWYVLCPDFIEVICERLYGFKKKKLILN